MEEQKQDARSLFRSIIDGSILTKDGFMKHLPYVIFLAILAIIYISNRFHAEKLVRDAAKLKKEIRDLRSESISIASELMYISNQTEVLKLIQEKDIAIKESNVPPKKIVIKKDEDD